MRAIILAVLLAAAPAVPAAEGTDTPCGTLYGARICVTAHEYGDEWPYKFPFGMLRCYPPIDLTILMERAIYGVNGKAIGNPKYRDPWLVRKDHPQFAGAKMAVPDALMRRGLALCE